MAKIKMLCPFSGKLCRECGPYRGRHYYIGFYKVKPGLEMKSPDKNVHSLPRYHFSDDQQGIKERTKEISFIAQMSMEKMLGWSHKRLVCKKENLSELLKQIITKDENSLYDVLIQRGGAVRPEYMICLNGKQIKQNILDVSLQSGDEILLTPIVRFAVGG